MIRLRNIAAFFQKSGVSFFITITLVWFMAGCTSDVQPIAVIADVSTPVVTITKQVVEPAAGLTKQPTVPTLAAKEIVSELVPTRAAPVQITAVPTVVIMPTVTATPTVTPTPKPSPTTEPDRYCPETAPLKPEYDRFFLPAPKWSYPDSEIAENHFWLSKPLPGAGRTLINQRFPYGWDENGRLLLHNGVDIAEDLGTPVLAVADGTVVVAQSDLNAWYGWRCDWYGHLVVIELDETWQDQPIYALYGHVLDLKVEPGERVTRGQPVAEVGFGGAVTNPHLHFEVRIGENLFDATRNPMLWLDPGPTRGVIAGRLVDPEGRPWQGVPLALVGTGGTTSRASTWSYLGDPQDLMNPDEGWAENFVFSDIQPGIYDIYTSIQGVDYRKSVTVRAGEVTAVEIETHPLMEPTPGVSATAEAEDEEADD